MCLVVQDIDHNTRSALAPNMVYMMLYKYANKHTNRSQCESHVLQAILTIVIVTDESSLPKSLI